MIKKKYLNLLVKVEVILLMLLRLLNLPKDVLKIIEEKKITAGHAKILVGLENASFIANKIIEKKLSVRQTENFVKIFKKKSNFLNYQKILI